MQPHENVRVTPLLPLARIIARLYSHNVGQARRTE